MSIEIQVYTPFPMRRARKYLGSNVRPCCGLELIVDRSKKETFKDEMDRLLGLEKQGLK
jgi:hypothetical protein